MHQPNWIELAGVVNMRDLGGAPTEGGDVVRARRLLRSDNLQDLPAASVRVLVETYGVTDVVDLRTHVELAREGDGPLRSIGSVRHHHLTLYREDSVETGIPAGERSLPWEAQERRAGIGADSHEPPSQRTPKDHDAFWTDHYLSYLADRPDSVIAALAAIADAEGAAVVHCAAGKDRTGTVVGLALKTVGVPDDVVMADFAASAERIEAIMARLRTKDAYASDLEHKTATQQAPRADTMRLLLAALETRYGGVHGWLGEQGWTSADTDRLRRKLLSD